MKDVVFEPLVIGGGVVSAALHGVVFGLFPLIPACAGVLLASVFLVGLSGRAI